MEGASRRALGRTRGMLRTQLWPLPAVSVLLAVALGVGLPRLDARVDDSLPASVTAYLFGGGTTSARAVLSEIAGSLITVTSLTFSLTVVTLQLASSQFSPRLLRTFARDRFVHITLALFLGTFTYALTVMRTVRDPDEGEGAFVPQISVTLAFALTLVSVLALVLFLAHLAREIRIETMLRAVHRDADVSIERDTAAMSSDHPSGPVVVPDPPADAERLTAASSGFLVQLNERALLRAAVDADAVLVLDCLPGSSLVAGTPIGACWPRGGGAFPPDTLTALRRAVARSVSTGFERTDAQDVGYGLRQLTDVADKALSPGINDPTTAVHALGHISALLCTLATRDLGPVMLRDEDERARVVLIRPDLGDLLEVAIGQPRRYGAGDPLVLARLFTLLRELAWVVRGPVHHAVVAAQLARLHATAEAQDFDSEEHARMQELAGLVEQALSARWPLRRPS